MKLASLAPLFGFLGSDVIDLCSTRVNPILSISIRVESAKATPIFVQSKKYTLKMSLVTLVDSMNGIFTSISKRPMTPPLNPEMK